MDSFYVLELVLAVSAIGCATAALITQVVHQRQRKAFQSKPLPTENDPNHPWVQMITAHFEKAVEEAIEEHWRNGRQIVVERNGKLVYLSPGDK